MRLHIGTSGWSYPHWRGPFYPGDLPAAKWLRFYARHFTSVEINSSFYRLPSSDTFVAWRDQVPDDFIFSVKASRYITHMKKLIDPVQTLPPLLTAAAGLADKLGPVLFQLPPGWKTHPARLRAFLQALPQGLQTAFELRDPSWHTGEILDLLAAFNAAFCIYDLRGYACPRPVTADFAYLRLHGPAAPYCGHYDTSALEDWADWLMGQDIREAYVYFDNDQAAHAVSNAMELQTMLGSQGL